MAKLQRRSLSNRVVDRLSVEGKDVIYWNRDLPGFGRQKFTRAKDVPTLL